MAKLTLEGVTRFYPGAAEPALEGLDLAVEDGEILVLVGPSGCGKSTALRLVAGLDLPQKGTLSLDGRDLARVPPQDRDVAMVFQGYALYPHMTVEQNIAFPLKMRGVAKDERARRVREAAERLSIERLLGRLPGELSGGQRQRVAMGRALVRKPKIFLFDEPLSNLDAALRQALRVELARLLRSIDATAIYVTHDQVEAMTIGDRIAVMKEGKIEQIGTPRAIYESPRSAFVAGFIGTPSINLIEVEVELGRAKIGGRSFSAPRGVRFAPRMIAAIRPEAIEVRAADDEGPSTSISLAAKVVASEPLGGETILHTEADAGSGIAEIRAKVPGFFDVALSDQVRLVVDPARVHWFEPTAEEPRG